MFALKGTLVDLLHNTLTKPTTPKIYNSCVSHLVVDLTVVGAPSTKAKKISKSSQPANRTMKRRV
jgi:hypothetical protein